MNPAVRKQAGLGYSGRGLCGLGAGWDRPPRLGIAALALSEAPARRESPRKGLITHAFMRAEAARACGIDNHTCRHLASVYSMCLRSMDHAHSSHVP